MLRWAGDGETNTSGGAPCAGNVWFVKTAAAAFSEIAPTSQHLNSPSVVRLFVLVGTFQFFGVWELWQASSQLLRSTLGAEMVDSADLDPAPENAIVSFWCCCCCCCLSLSLSLSLQNVKWRDLYVA